MLNKANGQLTKFIDFVYAAMVSRRLMPDEFCGKLSYFVK